MKVSVTCPFCDHTEAVRVVVSPDIKFGWTYSTLFMSAKLESTSGIEHHCPVLKKARSRS